MGAIDEAINVLDPPRPRVRLPHWHNPPNFQGLAPAQPRLPTLHGMVHEDLPFIPLPEDDEDDDDEEDSRTGREMVQGAMAQDSSSAAVTRFLIKHLPKQLTQLKEEKGQLEDKIHDLELVVSEQRMQMAEHERRVEDAITSAKKMETRLKAAAEDKKKLQKVEEASEEKEMAATFRIPVQVTEEDTLLSWSVESRQERPCCFWLNFIPAGGEACDSVILPCRAQDTTPLEPHGLLSCLQVDCGHKGLYTLHIEGSGQRMPQVSVSLTSSKKV